MGRYLAEFKIDDARKAAIENAHEAYQASFTASQGLPANDPVRLGVALNYSVFQYETLGNVEEACKIAREAFEDAIVVLDSVCGGATPSMKAQHRTLIMQLLRDNLTMWSERASFEEVGNS